MYVRLSAVFCLPVLPVWLDGCLLIWLAGYVSYLSVNLQVGLSGWLDGKLTGYLSVHCMGVHLFINCRQGGKNKLLREPSKFIQALLSWSDKRTSSIGGRA